MTQSILERQVHFANSYKKLWGQVARDKPCPPVPHRAIWVSGRTSRIVEVQEVAQMKRSRSLLNLIDAQIAGEEKK